MIIVHCEDCAKGHCDRWDHLVEAVERNRHPLLVIADRLDEAIRRLDEVPSRMADEVEPSVPATPTEGGVGRTLREHLLEVYRRTAQDPTTVRTPSDDDVKVTVHG